MAEINSITFVSGNSIAVAIIGKRRQNFLDSFCHVISCDGCDFNLSARDNFRLAPRQIIQCEYLFVHLAVHLLERTLQILAGG